MQKTPNSSRLHIGIFGRTNVGKSTLLNLLTDQEVSIVSNIAGTTTNSVKKAVELHDIGAVLFTDTAGVDDASQIKDEIIDKVKGEIKKTDLAIMLFKEQILSKFDEMLIEHFLQMQTPILFIINKFDNDKFDINFQNILKKISPFVLCLNLKKDSIDEILISLEQIYKQNAKEKELFEQILEPNSLVVLVTPIDKEAPKDRLILPQVQALRNILDKNSNALVTQKIDESLFKSLAKTPDLIVADSSCILESIKNCPESVKITTFSILMARLKGDLRILVNGANALDALKLGDKILIAEACSHRYIEGDIARTKIPKLLEKYLGFKPTISYVCGNDFGDISEFSLILHCGACMINRKFMIYRQNEALKNSVPITNYGVAISKMQGVLDKVLEIFSADLKNS
ncbi:[FeFe] hydrogenase H-cluster maturation GTPase HydF [Campylobacter fetus]|uniref:[FeFe] hydrogenase H-cluster maturation GTPase HydF n=1 Tax=Campylobacter fetus TaxID=196 RepID=UPI000818B93B|nr:[FeFe] hydrogenase H-cluster maturation GTPase HydF [Campylobacter fetus]OCR92067.1 hypothetical protein CFT12S02263_07665 [Campylobacter fetus subsp. testudinum]